MKKPKSRELNVIVERYQHNRDQHDLLISERDSLIDKVSGSEDSYSLGRKLEMLESKIEKLEELMYYAEDNSDLNLVKLRTRSTRKTALNPEVMAVNDMAIAEHQPAEVTQLFQHNPQTEALRNETSKKIDLFSTKKRVAENDICIYQDFINRQDDAPEEIILKNKELLETALEQRKMYSELLSEAENDLKKIDS